MEAVNSLQGVVQSIIQSISALVLPCALVTRLLPSSLGYSIWLLPSEAVKQVEATGMVGMMSPIDHELNNYLSFFRARRRREARAPPVNERGGSRSCCRLSGPGSCHLCPLPDTCFFGDGCALARNIAGRLRLRRAGGSIDGQLRGPPAPTPLVRGVPCVRSVTSR